MRMDLMWQWVVALCLLSAGAEAQWDVISGDTTLPGCRQLVCIDDATCIRSFGPGSNQSQSLAISTDAGNSWTALSVTDSLVRPAGRFFFRSARYGWVVSTRSGLDDSVSILRTVDGVTWQRPSSFSLAGFVAPPAQDGSSGIPALYMVSNTVGYAGGATMESGVLRPFLARTDDGGDSWSEQTPADLLALSNTRVETLYFVNSKVGFLSLSGQGDGTGVYRTEDGGDSFEPVSFGDTELPNPASNPVIQFAFPSASHGYALSADTDQSGGFSVTTDGGKTWESRVLDFDDQGNELHLRAYAMAFTSTTRGFLVGGAGSSPQIVRTDDGGKTFSTDTLPEGWGSTTSPVQCAAARTTGVEYAAGSEDARILRRGTPVIPGDTDGGVVNLTDAGTGQPSTGSSGGQVEVPGGGSGTPGAAKHHGKCSAGFTRGSPAPAFALGLLALALAQRKAARNGRRSG
jgi:hypothetical protein